MKWLRIINRLLIIEDPEPAPRSPKKLMDPLNVQNQTPRKIKVQTPSFRGVSLQFDRNTCNNHQSTDSGQRLLCEDAEGHRVLFRILT
jgi:hypothetical protein